MKVLVAFEESQVVCSAFLERGYDAWSCDLVETRGSYPERHITGDAYDVMLQKWDMIIAHPPCTYLTNAGVRWLKDNPERQIAMRRDAEGFRSILELPVPFIAVENPIMHGYAREIVGCSADQYIQPWQFGHTETKRTGWWLKNLPLLEETDNVKDIFDSLPKSETHKVHYVSPGPNRARERSETKTGIAAAIADQWGSYVMKELLLS